MKSDICETLPVNKWAKLGKLRYWYVCLDFEKERLLRAAKDKYELTAEEVDMIDSQYADAPTEELFDLILSDLYEVPT